LFVDDFIFIRHSIKEKLRIDQINVLITRANNIKHSTKSENNTETILLIYDIHSILAIGERGRDKTGVRRVMLDFLDGDEERSRGAHRSSGDSFSTTVLPVDLEIEIMLY